jgi:hypothetical protein
VVITDKPYSNTGGKKRWTRLGSLFLTFGEKKIYKKQ